MTSEDTRVAHKTWPEKKNTKRTISFCLFNKEVQVKQRHATSDLSTSAIDYNKNSKSA